MVEPAWFSTTQQSSHFPSDPLIAQASEPPAPASAGAPPPELEDPELDELEPLELELAAVQVVPPPVPPPELDELDELELEAVVDELLVLPPAPTVLLPLPLALLLALELPVGLEGELPHAIASATPATSIAGRITDGVIGKISGRARWLHRRAGAPNEPPKMPRWRAVGTPSCRLERAGGAASVQRS